jgi:hypothetical protein
VNSASTAVIRSNGYCQYWWTTVILRHWELPRKNARAFPYCVDVPTWRARAEKASSRVFVLTENTPDSCSKLYGNGNSSSSHFIEYQPCSKIGKLYDGSLRAVIRNGFQCPDRFATMPSQCGPYFLPNFLNKSAFRRGQIDQDALPRNVMLWCYAEDR